MLDDLAGDRVTRRLERLEADRDLVLRLSLQNWEGPEWDRFAAALAEYGVPILKAWIFSGEVFAQCTRKGIGFPAPAKVFREEDDAAELSWETIAAAIGTFRERVLRPGRWDPKRGASLRTFFVGQCLFSFPNVFRRWVKELDLVPPELQDRLADELDPVARLGPDQQAELHRAVGRLDPKSPVVIQALMDLGFDQGEIAFFLNKSRRAVESIVFREKRKREQKQKKRGTR